MSYKYYIGIVFKYEGDGFWNRDGDYIDRPIYEQPEQIYFDTIQEFFNKIVLVEPKDCYICSVKVHHVSEKFENDFPTLNIYAMSDMVEKLYPLLTKKSQIELEVDDIEDKVSLEEKRLETGYYQQQLCKMKEKYSEKILEKIDINSEIEFIIEESTNAS